jgi:hypothetical protein
MKDKDDKLFELYWDLLALEGKAFREQNPGLFQDLALVAAGRPAWQFVRAAPADLAAAKAGQTPVHLARFQLATEQGRPLIGWLDVFKGQRADDPQYLLRLRLTAADNGGDASQQGSLLAAYNQTYFEVCYHAATDKEERTLRLHVASDPWGDLASGLTPIELSGDVSASSFDVRAIPQHAGPARADSSATKPARTRRAS